MQSKDTNINSNAISMTIVTLYRYQRRYLGVKNFIFFTSLPIQLFTLDGQHGNGNKGNDKHTWKVCISKYDQYYIELIRIKYLVRPGERGTMKRHICPTLDGCSLRGGREENLNHLKNQLKTHSGFCCLGMRPSLRACFCKLNLE